MAALIQTNAPFSIYGDTRRVQNNTFFSPVLCVCGRAGGVRLCVRHTFQWCMDDNKSAIMANFCIHQKDKIYVRPLKTIDA